MKVYRRIQDFKTIKNAVTTVGIFDGVHQGHQKIIELVLNKAKQNKSESVLITFEPHPRLFFDPTGSQNLKLLTDIEERIHYFESLGIDNLLVVPFDTHTANLSSEEFIQQIVKDTVGTRTLLLGYDHKFGKNREGSFEYLKENQFKFGIQVFEISQFDIDDAAVSSTRIRNYLLDGNCVDANKLLGRNYSIHGTVIEGKKLGRTINVPTANISVANAYKLIPQMGVYAVYVLHENVKFGGMLNIGFNPTVSTNHHLKIEVHIFDFNKDIYGQDIQIEFVSRLRGEIKFNSVDELKLQLQKDATSAKEHLLKNVH